MCSFDTSLFLFLLLSSVKIVLTFHRSVVHVTSGIDQTALLDLHAVRDFLFVPSIFFALQYMFSIELGLSIL